MCYSAISNVVCTTVSLHQLLLILSISYLINLDMIKKQFNVEVIGGIQRITCNCSSIWSQFTEIEHRSLTFVNVKDQFSKTKKSRHYYYGSVVSKL